MPIAQEGVPRNRGSGGKPPMSARCAKALIEGDPQSLFGFFLVIQKETRPAGRNIPSPAGRNPANRKKGALL